MKALFISTTNKCNRSCSYCPMAKWRNNSPVYKDDLIASDVIGFIQRWKPDFIELTGGEPTLWDGYEELCRFLLTTDILWVTKSNGDYKGYNQVSAWHSNINKPPTYYDAILVIQDGRHEEKEKFLKDTSISFVSIGFNNNGTYDTTCFFNEKLINQIEMLFICPDGGINYCHDYVYLGGAYRGETEHRRLYINHAGIGYPFPEPFHLCGHCKKVMDLMIFLPLIHKDAIGIIANALKKELPPRCVDENGNLIPLLMPTHYNFKLNMALN